MKRITRQAAAAALMAMTAYAAHAQSAVDAYTLSRHDLRGSARFMSMGGAFGALGGDMSVLDYNPGGIAVYRSNDIGLTLDLDAQNSTAAIDGMTRSERQTKLTCNSFGYIGAVSTGANAIKYVTFGATYSRANSFNRRFSTPSYGMDNSYTNYIAGVTSRGQWSESDMLGTQKYNPYVSSDAPFMSILSYNSYLINPDPTADNSNNYTGLWGSNSSGLTRSEVIQEGYTDQYNLAIGFNIHETFFVGVSFGVTDINYTERALLIEDIDNAVIPNVRGNGIQYGGTAGYDLNSYKHITGNGFNCKIGLIYKPIHELRLGLAFHTPTWYNLTMSNYASVDYVMSYKYHNGDPTAADSYKYDNWAETNEGYDQVQDWKLRTPCRLIASAATVIANSLIISADYEYRPMQYMHLSDYYGDAYKWQNQDVKDYYKAVNIMRLGAELRLPYSLSLRAGFAYENGGTRADARDGHIDVYTEGPVDAGTSPSFDLTRDVQHVSCGLGWRYNSFYADLAYVNRRTQSYFFPYTSNDFTGYSPRVDITDTNNNVVLTLGFRF